MIADANLKNSFMAKYKGYEIEIVTDLDGVVYFRQRHIADVLGITRNALINSIRDRLGCGVTVYFIVDHLNNSVNPTGFLNKSSLTELLIKRRSKKSKLLLAWVERN